MKIDVEQLVVEVREIPGCIGRIICELGTSGPLVQWNTDGRKFELLGGNKGTFGGILS